MAEPFYPPSSRELAETRQALAPDTEKAFQAFSQNVFADGALSAKTKQLIAVAVAHVTQCPYCIRGHTKACPFRAISDFMRRSKKRRYYSIARRRPWPVILTMRPGVLRCTAATAFPCRFAEPVMRLASKCRAKARSASVEPYLRECPVCAPSKILPHSSADRLTRRARRTSGAFSRICRERRPCDIRETALGRGSRFVRNAMPHADY
jgi:Carboxymuconolactone decarboxylase family